LLLHSERIRGLAVQVGGVLVLFRAAAEKAEAAGCAGESFFGSLEQDSGILSHVVGCAEQ
jgi:hypothetical protein